MTLLTKLSIRLMHDFSRERQPLYCDVIIGKQIILIKLDVRQMQELTNDYYSVIKLHNIFHIAYKANEFSTNKKEPTITFRIPILERQRGSH